MSFIRMVKLKARMKQKNKDQKRLVLLAHRCGKAEGEAEQTRKTLIKLFKECKEYKKMLCKTFSLLKNEEQRSRNLPVTTSPYNGI